MNIAPEKKELNNNNNKSVENNNNLEGHSAAGNTGYLEEVASVPNKVTIRPILEQLRKTYTGTLAVDYMHIGDVIKILYAYWRCHQNELDSTTNRESKVARLR